MNEPKVAREVAEADFERFCEMLDAYSSADDLLNEEDVKSFEDNKGKFVRAVMNGSLVVEEDGTPVYMPRMGDWSTPLRFTEPDAGMISVSVDLGKEREKMRKQIALIAAMTKRTPQEIGRLKQRDFKICNMIVGGFFD